jgi:dCTP deaminase
MAILNNDQIKDYIKRGEICFNPPLDKFQVKPHAVDLRMGFVFLLPKQWYLDSSGRRSLNIDHYDVNKKEYFDVIELKPGQTFDLLPEEYVIVSTLEKIKVPKDLMSILYPRSSTNRKGLSVDLTGIIDAGYEGPLMIPIRNNTRSQVVKLYPGERFCQIVFERLDESLKKSPGKENRYHKVDFKKAFTKVNSINNKNKDEELEKEYVSKGKIDLLKKKFKEGGK